MGVRAVLGTAAVVAVLVGGAAFADGVARETAESRLAEEAQQRIAGLDARPDVSIGGWPFLTQVAGGELSRVDISAEQAVVEGLTLEDVVVRLTGVSTDQPTTARTAEMSAVARVAALPAIIDLDAELSTRDGVLLAQGELLGIPVEIGLVPSAAGREIAIDVQEILVGGGAFDLSVLPGLDRAFEDLSVPVNQLPPGLELTDVRVEGDVVVLEAAGSDVVLEQRPAG
jgi:hypothetical protein